MPEEMIKRILASMDPNTITKEQFATSFKNVVDYVKKIEKRNVEQLTKVNSLLTQFLKKIKDDTTQTTEQTKRDMLRAISAKVNELSKEYRDKIYEIDNRLLTVRDGKDADEELIVQKIKEQMPVPTMEEIANNLSEFADKVRDALELLKEDDRLDIEAIKGWDKLPMAKGGGFGGGVRSIQLKVDGAKKGLANMLNFIAGDGMTITYSKANGRNDITFTAGGGNIAILTATGDVDDSNKEFAFETEPVVVVVNGAAYRENAGYSLDGTTITLDNPVGTGGDIYGLG